MTVPAELLDAVGRALGERALAAEPVAGGSINRAAKLTLASGREVFLKHRPDVRLEEFETEAAGLKWLAEPGAVRLPAALAIGSEPHAWLALEWIEPGRLSAEGAEELGRGLARLHRAGATAPGALPPGRPDDRLRIGPLELPLPQASEPNSTQPADGPAASDGPAAGDEAAEVAASDGAAQSWPEFYAERLILPLAQRARGRGALSESDMGAIARLCDRIEEVAGPPEPPARLHGDLWAGNVHADVEGRAWLIDPAAYAGRREIDLAMLRLFGTPGGERLFSAYAEEWPPADGYRERVELWQLLPLLVHAVLFGGHYGEAAGAAARAYL